MRELLKYVSSNLNMVSFFALKCIGCVLDAYKHVKNPDYDHSEQYQCKRMNRLSDEYPYFCTRHRCERAPCNYELRAPTIEESIRSVEEAAKEDKNIDRCLFSIEQLRKIRKTVQIDRLSLLILISAMCNESYEQGYLCGLNNGFNDGHNVGVDAADEYRGRW